MTHFVTQLDAIHDTTRRQQIATYILFVRNGFVLLFEFCLACSFEQSVEGPFLEIFLIQTRAVVSRAGVLKGWISEGKSGDWDVKKPSHFLKVQNGWFIGSGLPIGRLCWLWSLLLPPIGPKRWSAQHSLLQGVPRSVLRASATLNVVDHVFFSELAL